MVAGFLPDPKDRYFAGQSLDILRRLLLSSKTGTMVLFTAYKDLNFIFDSVNEELYARGLHFYAQGKGAGRSQILNEFRKQKDAILLGTNSFWEGVDIPGESLSLLVLYKLPFMVPSDPIVEAFLEKLQMEGKDSFLHYMLPNALLRYRQGFGRLIRNKTDKGLVLILDSRINSKNYGHYFSEIVPTKTLICRSPEEIMDIIGDWFKEQT